MKSLLNKDIRLWASPLAWIFLLAAGMTLVPRQQALAAQTYQDADRFAQMSLVNIAGAGIFSSDRSVRQYAQEIWKL